MTVLKQVVKLLIFVAKASSSCRLKWNACAFNDTCIRIVSRLINGGARFARPISFVEPVALKGVHGVLTWRVYHG